MTHFSKSELITALSEVKYGIIAYRIVEDMCNAHQAVSEVDLLEKRQIKVRLTARGYEEFQSEGRRDEESHIYETLEDFLWSVSPTYRERHQEEIIARLSQLDQTDAL